MPAPREVAGSPGRLLTLDQAINATLLDDPKIHSALEVVCQAQAGVGSSKLLPNPVLLADLQLVPLTRPFTVAQTGGPPQTDFQVAFPVDWLLFGKRAAAMASAAEALHVSEAEFASLVRQRVTSTALAYFTALQARATRDLEVVNFHWVQQVEERLRTAGQADKQSDRDRKRLQIYRCKQEQTLRNAESALAVALAQLQAAVGCKEPGPDIEVTGSLEVAPGAPCLPVEQVLALAEQHRADILALRLRVEKVARDVDTEKTKGYPNLGPMLGYTRQFQEKAIGAPDINAWNFTLNMSVPIFDRNQYGVAAARSLLKQSKWNLEAALVNLRAEVVQVMQNLQTARRNAESLAVDQFRAAVELRDSVEKAYSSGASSLSELLDARQSLQEVARQLIAAQGSYWQAVVNFNATVGKQVLPYGQQPAAGPAVGPRS
jgi:cobalt-zinc-cadmium efflux system outer membrane protein